MSVINLLGSFFIASGAMILSGRKRVGSIFLLVACLIMMATKDNPWIKTDVAAINREKDQRFEWFATDVSLCGVALIFMGGMGE